MYVSHNVEYSVGWSIVLNLFTTLSNSCCRASFASGMLASALVHNFVTIIVLGGMHASIFC